MSQRKRGQPRKYATDEIRRNSRTVLRRETRFCVDIGVFNQDRWALVKSQANVTSNSDFAGKLLDRYERSLKSIRAKDGMSTTIASLSQPERLSKKSRKKCGKSGRRDVNPTLADSGMTFINNSLDDGDLQEHEQKPLTAEDQLDRDEHDIFTVMKEMKPFLVKGGKFFWMNMGSEGSRHTATGVASSDTMMALGTDIVPDVLYPGQLFNLASVQEERAYRVTNIKFRLHQSLAENISLHLISAFSPGNHMGTDHLQCKAVTAVYICDMAFPIHRCLEFMKPLHMSTCGIKVFYAFSLKLYVQESETEVVYDCENHLIRTFAISTSAFDKGHQGSAQQNNANENVTETECLPEPGVITGHSNPMVASEKSFCNYMLSGASSAEHAYAKTLSKDDTSTSYSSLSRNISASSCSNENFVMQVAEVQPVSVHNEGNSGIPDLVEHLECDIGDVWSSVPSNPGGVSGVGPVPISEPWKEYRESASESHEGFEQTVQADLSAYIKVESYEERVNSSTDTASEVGETCSSEQDEENLTFDDMETEEEEVSDSVSEDQLSESTQYEPDSFDSTEEDDQEQEEVLEGDRAGGLPPRRAATIATKLVRKKWKTIFGEDFTATDTDETRKKQVRCDDRDYNPDRNSDSSINSDSNVKSDSSDASEKETSQDHEKPRKRKRVRAERRRCPKCYFIHEQQKKVISCFICNPLCIILNPDPPLRRHSEETSYPDLPEGLKYVTSDVDGNLKTVVVTNKLINKGTQFGPVVGCTLPYEELDCTACNEQYYWPSYELKSRTTTVVDTSNLTQSNWFHFLKGSNTDGNMFQVYKEDAIYLVTCNDIAENQELTVMPYSKIFSHSVKAFLASQEESFQHLSCARCNIQYKCRLNLCRHLLVFHTKNYCFKTINCATCGLLICTKKQLLEHVRKHGGNVYKCDVCGRKSSSISSLAQHKRLEHTTPCKDACLCDLCGKTFSTKVKAYQHRRKVHEGSKQKCPKCPKVFNAPQNLSRHLKYHTKIYSFTCDRCGKRFVDKGNLDVHMLTHSGRKPFKCTECTCGFTTKQSLQSHYKKKHGYTMESMPEIKRLFPMKENDRYEEDID